MIDLQNKLLVSRPTFTSSASTQESQSSPSRLYPEDQTSTPEQNIYSASALLSVVAAASDSFSAAGAGSAAAGSASEEVQRV